MHSVRIVIFDRTDPKRFLAITESDDPDNWKLPGGKFEPGESPAQAAARELHEELGLTTTEIDLQTVATLANDDGVSARYIYAGMVAPSAIMPSAEIAQATWFTEQTLPAGKNHGHMLSAVAAVRARLR